MAKVKIYDGSSWVELLKSSDISAWAKASSKPSYSFSEISSRGEALLDWGGRSIGGVTPVGAALSTEHSANRLAFINGSLITAEYSSNGGSSWTEYTATASEKSQFCTQTRSFPVGRPNTSTEITVDQSKTRFTITAQNGSDPSGRVYTDPRKMLVYVSTATPLELLIEYRSGTNYKNNGSWSTFGTYMVGGWSGWNDIPLILDTLGGSSSQTGNTWQLRLTFTVKTKNSSYPKQASVEGIRIYGSNYWAVPSTYALTGHMYTFDMSKNVAFPAGVSATSFAENGTALSSKYLALSGGTLTSTSSDTPLYIKGNNNSGSYIGFRLQNGTTVGYLGVNSSNQPVFYKSNPQRIALYSELPTKSSWNYDDTYLKLTGGNVTGDLALCNSEGGSSPRLTFQRGTLTDTYNDWSIYDSGGYLYIQQRGYGSTAWETRATFTQSGVSFAGSISENGSALSEKYQAKGSYLSSVSINGTSGSSFTLNGSNLNVSSSDQTKISAAISALQTTAAGLSSAYAIDVTETDSNNANCYNKIFNDDVTGNIIEALNDYFVANITVGGSIPSGTHGASYASNSAALAYIKTAGGTNVLLSSLKVGDTIFLRQTNLPDVWVTEVSGVGTSTLTIGFSVLEPFKLVWGAIYDVPESFTPSSHSHGNITNSGTITSTAVTSATGVLVYDSNNKIQRATAANARAIIGAGTGNGTVTSVRVQAGTGLSSSTSTAQSGSLDTTISIASGYKLPTTTEWNGKQNTLTAQTAYSAKGSATKVPQITTNSLGQVTGITEVPITNTKTYKHDIAITDSSNSYIINFTAYSNTSTALTVTGAIQLLFNKPPAVASGNRLSAWAKSSVPLSIVKVEWTQSYFYPRAILAAVTYSGNNLTSFTIRPMEGAMDFDGYNMRISLFTSDVAFTVSNLSISDTVTEC